MARQHDHGPRGVLGVTGVFRAQLRERRVRFGRALEPQRQVRDDLQAFRILRLRELRPAGLVVRLPHAIRTQEQADESATSADVVAVHLEVPLVELDRRGRLAQVLLHPAEQEQHARARRVQVQRALECGLGGGELTPAAEHGRDLEPRLTVIRVDVRQPAPRALGDITPSQLLCDTRRGAQHLDLGGIDVARALERGERFRDVPGAEACRALQPERPPIIGVVRQRTLRELERTCGVAELRAQLADPHQQVGRARIERERAVVLAERLRELASLLEQARRQIAPKPLLAREPPGRRVGHRSDRHDDRNARRHGRRSRLRSPRGPRGHADRDHDQQTPHDVFLTLASATAPTVVRRTSPAEVVECALHLLDAGIALGRGLLPLHQGGRHIDDRWRHRLRRAGHARLILYRSRLGTARRRGCSRRAPPSPPSECDRRGCGRLRHRRLSARRRHILFEPR